MVEFRIGDVAIGKINILEEGMGDNSRNTNKININTLKMDHDKSFEHLENE